MRPSNPDRRSCVRNSRTRGVHQRLTSLSTPPCTFSVLDSTVGTPQADGRAVRPHTQGDPRMSVSRLVIRRRRTICVLTVVLVTFSAPAHAQQFYVGGGYGYTFAAAAPGYTWNIAFFVEFESPEGPLGVRFDGHETISLLFLTANVTYAFGSRDAQFQPYLVGGFGTALDLSEQGYTLNAGGGLRVQIPQFKTGPVCGSARVSSAQERRVSANHSASHCRGSGRILMRAGTR